MLIEFKCPHCQSPLRAGSELAGKEGACPKCKKAVTVPEESEETQRKTEEAPKKG